MGDGPTERKNVVPGRGGVDFIAIMKISLVSHFFKKFGILWSLLHLNVVWEAFKDQCIINARYMLGRREVFPNFPFFSIFY